jgi:hypothetical protein
LFAFKEKGSARVEMSIKFFVRIFVTNSICNMADVTARYTSPTHSLIIAHPVNPSDGSQSASLEALRQAVLSTQAELNAFLTERKLEEDRVAGVSGTSSANVQNGDDEEQEMNGEEGENEDEE